MVLRVEESGESESPTVMAGIRAATSLDTKVGRLPLGHLWRENMNNRWTRKSR
jgi:hypothetical protein